MQYLHMSAGPAEDRAFPHYLLPKLREGRRDQMSFSGEVYTTLHKNVRLCPTTGG